MGKLADRHAFKNLSSSTSRQWPIGSVFLFFFVFLAFMKTVMVLHMQNIAAYKPVPRYVKANRLTFN